MSFSKIAMSVGVVFLASCAHTAKHFDSEVQNADLSRVYQDAKEVVSYVPAEATISTQSVSVEFTKQDKLIVIQNRKAPVKHLKLQISDAPYLRISGVHVQNIDGKTIGVHPIFKIMKDSKELPQPQLKKVRWRGICGMHACDDRTFDLSSLPKGEYDFVVAAYVKDPDNPDGKLFDSIGRSAPLYPAYYGEVRFVLFKTLD